ncbi:MAG: helix-turn-helix domain-containing protein [Deltaproteobacteria bacterium]|nr:helix-turn-helix domain-containing protein [Deltaproteobacteria bacterium]
MMMEYAWPGNVRELENCLERALLLSQGKEITRNHLSIRASEVYPPPELSLISLRENSKELIETALRNNGYNITRTAKILGISRPTLYRKIKQFDIS